MCDRERVELFKNESFQIDKFDGSKPSVMRPDRVVITLSLKRL